MTRILCLGDSITDCGRLFSSAPLGNGYVNLLHQYQKERRLNWDLINRGFDGFTAARLADSIRPVCQDLSADIITILIGINDIALIMNTCSTAEKQDCLMQRFFFNYNCVIEMLKGSTKHFILMEPFLFPWPQEYRNWIPRLKEMSQGISRLAKAQNCYYLTLHDHLNEYARNTGTASVTIDGVHLTEYGHRLLADRLFPILEQYAH